MWNIETTDMFDMWFDSLDDIDKESVLASLFLFQDQGPMLGQSYADTVYGSRYKNMKELRIQTRGNPLRSFYAFDPNRNGILLCAGNKSGKKCFYEEMIEIADLQFEKYLSHKFTKVGDQDG